MCIRDRLIQRILRTEVDKEQLQKLSSEIARLAEEQGKDLSPRKIAEVLKAKGFEVDENALARLLKPQKAYILLNLDPRYPIRDKLKEILDWDEVDQVDEIYGDADLIIVARLEDDVVDRVKKLLGKAIIRMRTLITD